MRALHAPLSDMKSGCAGAKSRCSSSQKENLVFRRFRKDVIDLKPKDMPKGIDSVFVDPQT